jgi:hypothetical protein
MQRILTLWTNSAPTTYKGCFPSPIGHQNYASSTLNWAVNGVFPESSTDLVPTVLFSGPVRVNSIERASGSPSTSAKTDTIAVWPATEISTLVQRSEIRLERSRCIGRHGPQVVSLRPATSQFLHKDKALHESPTPIPNIRRTALELLLHRFA